MSNLAKFISDMEHVNTISWEFNPWWHRVPNYLLSLVPKRKIDMIYVVSNDGEVYVGPERRSRISEALVGMKREIDLLMMTKTVQIPLKGE